MGYSEIVALRRFGEAGFPGLPRETAFSYRISLLRDSNILLGGTEWGFQCRQGKK